jgi:hypothetical protein
MYEALPALDDRLDFRAVLPGHLPAGRGCLRSRRPLSGRFPSLQSLTAKTAKEAKEEKSFTAKDAKDAEEKNSLTAKDAKKSIIRTKP